ncbi:hypothetical protein HYX05_00465 [Candidatus Woesearchaeota archaeon]|nr:hypothetical protein [Candidatus Woesearchaeota archaeon]
MRNLTSIIAASLGGVIALGPANLDSRFVLWPDSASADSEMDSTSQRGAIQLNPYQEAMDSKAIVDNYSKIKDPKGDLKYVQNCFNLGQAFYNLGLSNENYKKLYKDLLHLSIHYLQESLKEYDLAVQSGKALGGENIYFNSVHASLTDAYRRISNYELALIFGLKAFMTGHSESSIKSYQELVAEAPEEDFNAFFAAFGKSHMYNPRTNHWLVETRKNAKSGVPEPRPITPGK